MKKRISESIADAWGVPKEVIMNIPKLTIESESEIYIEKHKCDIKIQITFQIFDN